jgi:hypothetical protein
MLTPARHFPVLREEAGGARDRPHQPELRHRAQGRADRLLPGVHLMNFPF